ncbi:MAG: tetratricopeptide repeat protein [Nitrososphaeria archaeon]
MEVCRDYYIIAEASICLSMYGLAEEYYRRYLKDCNSKDPAAWHGLANALEEQGKNPTEAYRMAYELYSEDDWSSSLWKGWCALKLGDLNEALRLFSRAIQMNPDYAYAWESAAVASERLGLREIAKKYAERFRQLISRKPYPPRACEGLSMLREIEDDLRSLGLQSILETASRAAAGRC